MTRYNVKAAEVAVETVKVSVYRVPTDLPESDGTLAWTSTTMVLVEVRAAGVHGLGYTYGPAACGTLIQDTFAEFLVGEDAMSPRSAWLKMVRAIRNMGRPGISSMALSAVDVALWDLKARSLGLPLVALLGAVRRGVPVYGSGGFTSYSPDQLQRQLGGWVEAGIPRVKMKIGRRAPDDSGRVRAAREAIGADTALYVDANGAFSRKQALAMAEVLGQHHVSWFEEPVSSDDLEGLRLLRDRVPAGIEVSAGEYGYDLVYFRRMLEAGAVDVLQADLTRCGGITGFCDVAALSDAYQIPLSSHCAPALHLHPGCSAPGIRHLEYFHDHARIESLFFDGVVTPTEGMLYPDWSRPGLGLEFKPEEAEQYRLG